MSAATSERGDIATRILFENERVRVWEMHLEPGEQGPVHEHELDNILVQIHGDRVAVVPDPATRGEYTEYLEAEVVPGNTLFVRKGGIEAAKNVGNEPYFEILIELKD